jgi:hypothetical protein
MEEETLKPPEFSDLIVRNTLVANLERKRNQNKSIIYKIDRILNEDRSIRGPLPPGVI